MGKLQNLVQQAAVIRDATTNKENTATRVGTMFVNIIKAVIDILPAKVLAASGISVSQSANSVSISFPTIDSDGKSGTSTVTIPAATSSAAGLLTPAKQQEISLALNTLQEQIQTNDTLTSTMITSLQTALQTFKDSKGVEGGIAPLDSDGLVPDLYLPKKLDDVLEFDGVVTDAPNLQMQSATGAGNVVYCSATKRFLWFSSGTGKYYPNWAGSDYYGETKPDGHTAETGKLYVDVSVDKLYRWDGTDLKELSGRTGFSTSQLIALRSLANDNARLNHAGLFYPINITDESVSDFWSDGPVPGKKYKTDDRPEGCLSKGEIYVGFSLFADDGADRIRINFLFYNISNSQCFAEYSDVVINGIKYKAEFGYESGKYYVTFTKVTV